MKLIFIICRILAVILVCCVGALYFFNQEKLVSLQSSIGKANSKKVSVSLLLEKDKNESSNLINGLFRQRGKLRSSTEESTTSTESIRQEVDFIIPQKANLEKKLEQLAQEYSKIEQELQDQKKKNLEKKEENLPIQNSVASINKEIEEIKVLFTNKKKESSSLQAELSALKKKRDIAEESYQNRRKTLLEDVQVPPHIYYGDQIEVSVDNVAPSGKGIFISKGHEDGFRDSMKFLATVSTEIEKKYFLLQTVVVQKNLSFLEFFESEKFADEHLFREEEKLFLIRTGDSPKK